MSEQISQAVWNRFVARRSTDDVANGLVVKLLPFGAFVEIDGVTGLLRSDSAQPAPGGRVAVRVTTIDAARRRFAAETA